MLLVMIFHTPHFHAPQNVVLERQTLVDLAADAALARESHVARLGQTQLRLFGFLLFGRLQLAGGAFDALFGPPQFPLFLPVVQTKDALVLAVLIIFQIGRHLLEPFPLAEGLLVLRLGLVSVGGRLVGPVLRRHGKVPAGAVDASRGTVHVGLVIR